MFYPHFWQKVSFLALFSRSFLGHFWASFGEVLRSFFTREIALRSHVTQGVFGSEKEVKKGHFWGPLKGIKMVKSGHLTSTLGLWNTVFYFSRLHVRFWLFSPHFWPSDPLFSDLAYHIGLSKTSKWPFFVFFHVFHVFQAYLGPILCFSAFHFVHFFEQRCLSNIWSRGPWFSVLKVVKKGLREKQCFRGPFLLAWPKNVKKRPFLKKAEKGGGRGRVLKCAHKCADRHRDHIG